MDTQSQVDNIDTIIDMFEEWSLAILDTALLDSQKCLLREALLLDMPCPDEYEIESLMHDNINEDLSIRFKNVISIIKQ